MTRVMKRTRWLLFPAVIAGLAIAAVPAAASDYAWSSWTSSSQPAYQGVLYEVTENMYLLNPAGMPVASPADAATRMADATLQGWVKLGTPPCPTDILFFINATKCTITATGMDRLDIRPDSPTLWLGKVSGTYAIVVQDDNLADAPEVVIQTGTFEGDMDLSKRPLGTVKGVFKPCPSGDACGAYPFTGKFRLPFKVAADGKWVDPKRWEPALYLADDRKTFIYVTPGEYSLGYATVKLELSFP
jgi:hypothetical protein